MIENWWFDRSAGKVVYAVEDIDSPILSPRTVSADVPTPSRLGRSPRNLMGTALSDWLKEYDPLSKIYSIGGKDRTSILAGGRYPDCVYWYDTESGCWLTSRYYSHSYPPWVMKYNQKPGPAKYRESLMVDFAEVLIDKENMGADEHLDFLALTFYTLDVVGHRYGPDSQEVLHTLLSIDQAMDRLFRHLDRKVGLENVVMVVGSDHGIISRRGEAEIPGEVQDFDQSDVACFGAAENHLDAKWGEENWLPFGFYLNLEAIEQNGLARAEVEEELAHQLEKCSAVHRVWTRIELQSPNPGSTPYGEMYANSFHTERSPDLLVQFKEYHTNQVALAFTHGSPYPYDTHVPLVILYPGIHAGVVSEPIHTVDLAPTLAGLLGVPAPADLDGKDRSDLLRKEK
jgi:predicted AlkP superfamily pyrophosphatase or phosphodiesterase